MTTLRRTWQHVVSPARRALARVDWTNRHLPWRLWCSLAAADALTVAWVLAARSGRPLRFVQIGSNDGVLHDPIHGVIRAYGWTGVLIEPLPDLFAKLVANYDGVPGLEFDNVAIGEVEGSATIYRVDPRPGDPYWVGMIASFDRDVILSQHDEVRGVGERLIETEVEALTLSSLVARHGLESIDLLHVDAEGFDGVVLGQIEFDAPWAPSFIIFEREHLDPAGYRATTRALVSAGYRCVDVWPDTFAYRRVPAHR